MHVQRQNLHFSGMAVRQQGHKPGTLQEIVHFAEFFPGVTEALGG
jgi:hypothetical protein